MVRATSVITYHEILAEGLVGKGQEKVLLALSQLGKASDSMIARQLGFVDPNKVRPRRKELVDRGVVEMVGHGPCPVTGRTVFFWGIKNQIQLGERVELQRCPYCRGTGRCGQQVLEVGSHG